MTRDRLDNWCEKGIVALVLSILVFGPVATGAVRHLEFLAIQGLTMAALLLWLLRTWLNSSLRILWPPICWVVVAFVVYAVIRYRQADLEYAGRLELTRVVVYAVLFFVILWNSAQIQYAHLICYVLIFLAMAISIYAVYQFATNSDRVWHFIKPPGYRHRGSGTYICPNHLAGFLELLLPLGLSYALMGRVNHLLRIFLGYASLAILAGIGVSGSRGGWLATVLALAALFAVLVRRPQYRISVIAILILLASSILFFYAKSEQAQKRVREVITDANVNDVRSRYWLTKPTVQMWLDHFWLGVGPGHYDFRFPAYRPVQIQARPGRAHNDYLNTLADWGLAGAAIVSAAWALLFLGVFKTWKFVSREPSDLGTKPSNRSAFVIGAATGLVAILVHSLFDFNMHIPANAILTVALMSLLTGCVRFSSDRYWVKGSWMTRLAVTCVGLTALGFLTEQGLRRAREYVWLERAGGEKTYSKAMVAALERAAEAEPSNFSTAYSLGEALRRMSWQGDAGHEKLADEAKDWFQRGARLNPYDPYNYMKIGMCLDWLGKHDDAAPYFEEAVRRDPNNYYVVAHQGWHFVQTADYAKAKTWFDRSIQIRWWDNPIAYSYLSIIERKLNVGNSHK